MKGKFEGTSGKRRILGILTVFAIATLGITGHLRGVEGTTSGGNWTREDKTLTESEAEEVRAIWRVIGDQEIVTWDGEEWLAKQRIKKEKLLRKFAKRGQKQGIKKLNP